MSRRHPERRWWHPHQPFDGFSHAPAAQLAQPENPREERDSH